MRGTKFKKPCASQDTSVIGERNTRWHNTNNALNLEKGVSDRSQ